MKTISNESEISLDQSRSRRIGKVALPGVLAGGVLLIVYYLIILAFGKHTNTDLRWINFVLIIPVLLLTIKRYLKSGTGKTYVEALMSSIVSGIGAYAILSLFMFIYLNIDHKFMDMLYQQAYPELALNPLSIVLMLMFEGAVGSAIISFVLMQFYKDHMRNAA